MTAKPEPTGLGAIAMIAAFCGAVLTMGKVGGWVQRRAEERNDSGRGL